MKFLDLFAGIGGFRLGLEQAGHECVGFCEIDKFARQSYKAIYNTEGEREYHDITTVSNEEWRTLRGTVELICGGFPCQAFSITGKRKGFLDETRGTLFFEIARAAEQIKPRTLFLENVRGLLSHDKGRTFRTIISTLNELGYDAEWQILNSKNFGVPQNRERVFIIGHLRGERGREVFPITRENSGAIKRIVNGRETHGHSTYDVFGTDGISPTLKTMQGGNLQPKILVEGNIYPSNGQNGNVYNPKGLSPTLSSGTTGNSKNRGIGSNNAPKILVNVNPSGNGMNGNVYDSNALAPTLTTNKGEGPKIAIPVLTPDRAEKRQNGRRFKEDGDPMFTLTAQDRHGVAVKEATKQGFAIANLGDSINLSVPNSKTRRGRVGKQVAQTLDTSCNQAVIVQKPRGFNKGGEHEVAPTLSSNSWHENNLLKSGIRIRKLTPRECWRLQGFPDWAFDKAQEVNSNSQLYKQAGNSVTVPVIYEIARRFE